MARSYGQLFEKIAAPENLKAALKRAAKGKRERPVVKHFLARANTELSLLRSELLDGSYRPRPVTQFRIMDPKPRTITCADFRDRVVHHALCHIVSPFLENRFMDDSFACRTGKGSHRAVLRAQQFSRQYSCVWKADIRKFYDSIDHEVLLKMLCRRFREKRLHRLLRVLVEHPVPGQEKGKGLPIGNLTSQWFANFYLDRLDHYLKEELKAPAVVRYMDDFSVWSNSKEELFEIWSEARLWLLEELGLDLKPSACKVLPVAQGLNFLGVQIFPRKLRLQGVRLRRTRRLVARREKQFFNGELSEPELVQAIGSAQGLLGFFGFKHLILENGVEAVSGSNRVNRGGSWNNNASNCRSAYRNNNSPGNRNNNLGFRLLSTAFAKGMPSHPFFQFPPSCGIKITDPLGVGTKGPIFGRCWAEFLDEMGLRSESPTVGKRESSASVPLANCTAGIHACHGEKGTEFKMK